MPLPLKIVATPHAHDAQIVLIDDLLRKPSIYGPASRLLGKAFTNYVDNLPQRLCIGERAAALAKYGDKSVGTIVYNQSPEDPSTAFLELIATREKYRPPKSWYAIITTSRDWNSITWRNAITIICASRNDRFSMVTCKKRLRIHGSCW